MTSDPLRVHRKLNHPLVTEAAKKVSSDHFIASPLIVDLDPTSACDLDCPECISSAVLRSGGLTFDRLSRLATELREMGTVGVVLIGGGEPTMHRRFADILKVLRANELLVGLVTNGTMLDRYLDVIATTANWVRVSWDAGTETTYARIRPSRSNRNLFRKVVENTGLLASAEGPRVGVSYVAVPPSGSDNVGNIDEFPIAAAMAAEMNCSYIEVKALLDDGHHVIRYPETAASSLRSAISKARSLTSDKFSVYIAENLHLLLSHGSPEQTKTYDRCPSAALRALVAPGGVYPCAYHRGNEKLAYGKIQETEFKALWRAENVSKVNPSTDCQFFCARHDLNEILLKGTWDPEQEYDEGDPFI